MICEFLDKVFRRNF